MHLRDLAESLGGALDTALTTNVNTLDCIVCEIAVKTVGLNNRKIQAPQ